MNTSNTNITFKGNPTTVRGKALTVGATLPKFKLVGTDMKDVTNETFAGKVLVLSVVPSLDTPVCSIQTKHLSQDAAEFGDKAVVLTVSLDLPFAQKRWCGAEGVTNVVTASDYKYRNFGDDFGAYLTDLGLLARALFVVDQAGTIRHLEYVPEVAQEPDYNAALKVVRELL
ncbi:thiol peroxidase [bacterium]|nr:thiol peroxidase [bacterium]